MPLTYTLHPEPYFFLFSLFLLFLTFSGGFRGVFLLPDDNYPKHNKDKVLIYRIPKKKVQKNKKTGEKS